MSQFLDDFNAALNSKDKLKIKDLFMAHSMEMAANAGSDGSLARIIEEQRQAIAAIVEMI